MAASIVTYLNPLSRRREREQRFVQLLRERDGGECRRCRRPMRFDLLPGHELGARIEQFVHGAAPASGSIDNLCLTHGRCNRKAGHDTREVADRARQKAEIEMFDRDREKRRA